MEYNTENIVIGAAGIGSANIAASQFLDFSVMTDVFGSSPELGAAAFGVAGVLAVTETFEFTELLD